MTLRQALLSLEAESRIFRKDRKGWFVAQPRFNYSPELPASFQRAAIEQGENPRGALLKNSEPETIPTPLNPCWMSPRLMIYIWSPAGERWKGIKFSTMRPLSTLTSRQILLTG
jgi:hypothetical protein